MYLSVSVPCILTTVLLWSELTLLLARAQTAPGSNPTTPAHWLHDHSHRTPGDWWPWKQQCISWLHFLLSLLTPLPQGSALCFQFFSHWCLRAHLTQAFTPSSLPDCPWEGHPWERQAHLWSIWLGNSVWLSLFLIPSLQYSLHLVFRTANQSLQQSLSWPASRAQSLYLLFN